MLMQHTNLDDHLDFLEKRDGHLFKLSLKEMNDNLTNSLCDRIEQTIRDSDMYDTVVIIEAPTTRQARRAVEKDMKRLAKKIDGFKIHRIHIFLLPSEFFNLLTTELTGWE